MIPGQIENNCQADKRHCTGYRRPGGGEASRPARGLGPPCSPKLGENASFNLA